LLTTGDGYVVDFTLGMTSEEFKVQINDLMQTIRPSFISEQTAILIISFNCYDPSQD